MTPITVLQLMNDLEKRSIRRIVQQLLHRLSQQQVSWHIGGPCGLGDMTEQFIRLGTQMVDFSNWQNESGNPTKTIKRSVAPHHVGLVHTQDSCTYLPHPFTVLQRLSFAVVRPVEAI